jgi:hypothetical protein
LPKDRNDSLMAIVMLGDLKLPDIDSLSKAIQARLPDVPIPPEDSANKDGALLLFARDAMCGIMRLGAPCPISPQDSPFAAAWYWPQAWETLKDHKAHMIVSVSGADARARATLFGQFVAAAVEAAPSALGVFCASSDALWPAKAVPTMVAPRNNVVPLPLVVSAKLSRDAVKGASQQPGKISGITKGLAAFGLMEIESLGYSGHPQALSGSLLDLASYLIESGSAVKDGDTIGPDEKTKWLVRHESSRLAPGRAVYRLYFQ